MSELVAIVGTSVGVGATVLAGGAFMVRAIVAQDGKPLSDAMIRLTAEVSALRETIVSERETRKEDREEVSAILADLNKIVSDHETRISILEQPTPPAASARKRRAA